MRNPAATSWIVTVNRGVDADSQPLRYADDDAVRFRTLFRTVIFIPSLVPVVQLAHPGKLLGKMVERSGALEPSRIKRDKIGNRPSLASGEMMSKVAPSSPMITVFIQSVEALRFYIKSMRGSFSRQPP